MFFASLSKISILIISLDYKTVGGFFFTVYTNYFDTKILSIVIR